MSIMEIVGLELFGNVLGASKLGKKITRDGPRLEKVAILEDKHLFNLLTSCKEARLRLTGRSCPLGNFAGCAVDGFWRKKYLGLVEGDFSPDGMMLELEIKGSRLDREAPLPEAWEEPREEVIDRVGYCQAYKCFASWTCQFCGAIERAANPTTFVRVCEKCVKGVCPEQKVISKSKAKQVYMLNDSDLPPLPSAHFPSIGPFGMASTSGAQPMMEMFSIASVAERAKEKFGGEVGFKAEVEKRIAIALKKYESKKASGKSVKKPKTTTRCTSPWDFGGEFIHESGADYMVLPVGFKPATKQLAEGLAKPCARCTKNGETRFDDGHVCSMYMSMQACHRCNLCPQTGTVEMLSYHFNLEHTAGLLSDLKEGLPRDLPALSAHLATQCSAAQVAELESILGEALKNFLSKDSSVQECQYNPWIEDIYHSSTNKTITSFAIAFASGEEIKFASYLEDFCGEGIAVSRWQMLASGPPPACIPIVLLELCGGENDSESKVVDDDQLKTLADRIGLKHASPAHLLAFLMDLSCDRKSVKACGVVEEACMYFTSPVGASHKSFFKASDVLGHVDPSAS